MMYRLFFIFIGFTAASLLQAADGALEEARQAMADGLPQVAINKLSRDEQNFTPEEKQKAGELLAEALLAAGRAGEAVYILEKTPEPRPADIDYLLAEAYAATGQFQPALEIFDALRKNAAFSRRTEAAIGQARMLSSLKMEDRAGMALQSALADGLVSNRLILELARFQLNASHPEEARQVLEKMTQLSPLEQKEKDFLLARADIVSGKLAEADARLVGIQNPDANLLAAIVMARAEVQIQEKDLSAAEKVLEDFIERSPAHPALAEIFAQLDRVYALEGAASTTELRRWSENLPETERANLAMFYLARAERRISKLERSWQCYRDFLAAAPSHALAEEARAELASSLLVSGHPEDARRALEKGQGARVEYVRGQVLAALGENAAAAESFLQSATTENAGEALYNSAVCGMLAGFSADNNPALLRLKKWEGGGDFLEKFRFNEALYLAAKRQPGAVDLLRQIASENSSYAARARLALAEWEDLQLNTDAARKELKSIANDPSTQERKDYLEVFLADTGEPNSEVNVADKAGKFLDQYPDSPFVPEVRMKLGEMRFRSGDYLGARDQFDALVVKYPDSPLAGKALFLSAQSLARSMNPEGMKQAIEVYEDVVRQGGPLAVRARLAEALLQSSLDRPVEAIGILDSILAGTPDSEMRFMVQMEKGNTQFSMGAKDTQNYRNAIATWSLVAKDPEVTPQWRNQALYRMGTAYEKLGETDAALASYYDVLAGGQKAEPEYFWYYKAGFDAGDLLVSKKLFNEAIAVYEKLAAVEGPRAEKARSLVNKLRLENFIWEN